ncbi:hypothetical protein VB796_07530 [Arcicella sp. LKC2W]|nr:hypothetical protein [Arcicella sp. LKC2W]MEA5458882.1 hypothetical protein [Arcicella sp. LKC2W]
MIQNYVEQYTAKNGSDEVEKIWDEVVVWWDLGDSQIILDLRLDFQTQI